MGFKYAVAYKMVSDTMFGAFWGHSGGGVFDGGYFKIDSKDGPVALGFDSIEQHGRAEDFESCMREVARYYTNGSDADEPELSAEGRELMKAAEVQADGDLAFADDSFDCDAVADLSAEWPINLRFEW